jgi:hypothetical protein
MLVAMQCPSSNNHKRSTRIFKAFDADFMTELTVCATSREQRRLSVSSMRHTNAPAVNVETATTHVESYMLNEAEYLRWFGLPK